MSKRGNNKKTPAQPVFEQVYHYVLQIPPGQVMTYGQLSRLLEERLSPVGVGWALRAAPKESNVPWHRVINSRGGISTDKLLNHTPGLQQRLLEAEGVVFNEEGLLDLARYQWQPPARASRGKKA